MYFSKTYRSVEEAEAAIERYHVSFLRDKVPLKKAPLKKEIYVPKNGSPLEKALE